jgi:hypothetical protein
MTPEQLEQSLTIIARHAKDLREAGIVGRLTIGEISFELADAEPPAHADGRPDGHGNPIDDGDTYGGAVPRRRVQAYADEDDFEDDHDQE